MLMKSQFLFLIAPVLILLFIFAYTLFQPYTITTGYIDGATPVCDGYETEFICDATKKTPLKYCEAKCYGFFYYELNGPSTYQKFRKFVIQPFKPEWFASYEG